jgi:hypothetical protein
MRTTVITHIYNEAFLLPYWIAHHQKIFDHGIVIDYASTDESVEIVERMAPTWEVRQSPHSEFSAELLDEFVMSTEASLSGVMLALTVTEFLIGDPSDFSGGEIVIPTVDLVDMPGDAPFIEGIPFHEQRSHGIHYRDVSPYRVNGRGRLMHSVPVSYPLGRHYQGSIGGPFLIYRVAGCLVNEAMVKRKLQIQEKIPPNDVARNYGGQHHDYGRGLTRAKVFQQATDERAVATDLSGVLASALRRQEIALALRPGAGDEPKNLVRELVSERDELVSERDELVSKRDELLDHQAAAVEEHASRVAEFQTLVGSLEHNIVELRDGVAYFSNERELLLRDKDYLISERDTLNGAINDLISSVSWKLTKPLRALWRLLAVVRQIG